MRLLGLRLVPIALWLVACGGGRVSPGPPAVDADRLARRTADLLFSRIDEEATEPQRDRGRDTSRVIDRPPSPELFEGVPRMRVEIDDAPRRGSIRPLVVMVAFTDFQCPYCRRAAATVDRLLRAHPELSLVFRHEPLPSHHNAPLAHQAAIEAYRQGGDRWFWQMHDLLFAHQQALERPDIERYAQQVGLDMEFRFGVSQ